jgi:hypothetical protein
MNRFFVLLCVVFSLVLAPMAHAAGLDSSASGCSIAGQSSGKQDDGMPAGVGHHCCSHRIADRAPLEVTEIVQETLSVFTITEQTNLASIAVRPLLEPPSRA